MNDSQLQRALPEEPIDVLCGTTFAGLSLATRLKRVMLTPLMASATVGVVIYIVYFINMVFITFMLKGGKLDEVCDVVIPAVLQSASVLILVPLLVLPLVLSILFLVSWREGIATHVRVDKTGISFWGLIGGLHVATPVIPWSSIAKASPYLGAAEDRTAKVLGLDLTLLELPDKTRSYLSLLCSTGLQRQPGSSTVRLQIPIESFPSELDLERFILAVRAALPENNCTDIALLSPGALRPSYTDLWLDGLSPDTRSVILSEGMEFAGGRYVIDQVIGSGGEGVVYRAKQINDGVTESIVAIKQFVLPSSGGYLCAARALEHIQSETRLLARLSHPGIINLLDSFVEDSRVYLVFPLLVGKSLSRLVEDSGALTETRVIELSLQMCEILQYLHSQDPPIIHRDFTPDNLMLLEDGTLKLIDFNVAQQLEAMSAQSIVGKHSYMPPEQFRGKANEQSDLYALGATMYFLSTGEEPEPITKSHPRSVNANVSSALDEIVAHLTEPDVAQRYRQARDLKAALEAISSRTTASA